MTNGEIHEPSGKTLIQKESANALDTAPLSKPTLEERATKARYAYRNGAKNANLLMREVVMQSEADYLTVTDREELLKHISNFVDISISDILENKISPNFKFIREGDRVIVFPFDENDEFQHVHHAIAAGMTCPDDAGFITFDLSGHEIIVYRRSTSLWVLDDENAERQSTIELLRRTSPQEFNVNSMPS